MVQSVKIDTPPRIMRRMYATSVTDAAYTAPALTATKPSGDGVQSTGGSFSRLMFFGEGADGNAGQARILTWNKVQTVGDAVGSTLAGAETLWVPSLLTVIDFTLSATAGLAGSDLVDDSDLVADTFVLNSGDSDIVNIGEGDDVPGSIVVNPRGADFIEVQLTKGTATNVNVLCTFI